MCFLATSLRVGCVGLEIERDLAGLRNSGGGVGGGDDDNDHSLTSRKQLITSSMCFISCGVLLG